MNELEIAKAIAAGQLPSPQVTGNMVLFALRITGTGAAYREKWGEYVYRPPENYLHDDFLERCAGLPVIFNHPEGDILTHDNYKDFVIGSIIYAYLNDNEVWGIARIYDEDAALAIIDDNLSTSPTFILSNDNQKRLTLDDMTVLIEDRPELLDHVAICKGGVWDKGQKPNGILINNEDLIMPDSNKMNPTPLVTEGAAADASTPEPPAAPAPEPPAAPAPAPAQTVASDTTTIPTKDLDRILELIGMQQQLSEQQLHELEELKKSLGATTQDLTAKAEANEAANGDLTSRLSAIEDKMKEPQELTDDEKAEVADSEQEAEKVAQAFGDSVKHAMRGEKPSDFKRRVAKLYQKNSQIYSGVNLDQVQDKTALDIAFKQICADSVTAAAIMPRNNGRGAWIKETVGGRTIERVVGMNDANSFSEFRIKPRMGQLVARGDL